MLTSAVRKDQLLLRGFSRIVSNIKTYPATLFSAQSAFIRINLRNMKFAAATCGRICLGNKKINFSTVFAGQAVGIKEVHDDIWLVGFLDYDSGYFDLDTRVLEPLDNPFGPRVSPMEPVHSFTHVSGSDK
jgi:putative transposase